MRGIHGLIAAGGAVAALLLGSAGAARAAEIKIGGYTKLDAIWTDKIAGGGNGSASEVAGGPSAVPLDSQPQFDNGDFNLDARQSRLNFTGTGEVQGVKLKGFIESDFFTSEGNRNVSNSRGLRLRHAYGQATLPSGFFLLAGQTWSTFMNVDASPPETIDFNGPAGQLFNREPQLRVGYKAGGLSLQGSIESHSVSGIPDETPANPAGLPNSGLNQSQELPLFVAKAVWSSDVLVAEVAGAATENRVIAGGADETETAWGVQGSVQVPLGAFSLLGHIHLLDGLNRIANGDFNDARASELAGVIQLENVETLGWYVGANYKLSDATRLNAVYGWAEADESALNTGASDETHQTLHLNVLHKLWGSMQVGLEYQYAKRELFNGDEGDLNRIQFGWWYFF